MHIDPYSAVNSGGGEWLRANFHTHAGTGKGTCGVHEIEDVVAAYKEAKYDVLTISNHDLYSDVRELQAKYEITLLNGFEHSIGPHVLCIGTKDRILGSYQEVIDECSRQGGFTIICHPNWQKKEYWPWEELDALEGHAGIEIYNGVIFRLNGTGLATDAWDHLLSQGRKVWGFGSDDFHRWFDMARAWNVIYSLSKEQEDIKEAIRNGAFYISTGLILNEYECDGKKIRIMARSKDTYVKESIYRFIGKDGRVLSEQNNGRGEYEFTGDESYVRVQVISEHGAMLWTQPVFYKY